MAANSWVRRDGWRAWQFASATPAAVADSRVRPSWPSQRMWRRATIDVRLTASAVLIAGSELLLTVWLVAAAAVGFYALVTLVR